MLSWEGQARAVTFSHLFLLNCFVLSSLYFYNLPCFTALTSNGVLKILIKEAFFMVTKPTGLQEFLF